MLVVYSFREQQQLYFALCYILKLSLVFSKDFHESDSRESTVSSAVRPQNESFKFGNHCFSFLFTLCF